MIRSTARRLGAVAALSTGMLVASAVGAQAQQVVVDDAAHDVVMYDESSDTFVPAPEIVNGDVLRTCFQHTDRRVRTHVAFADLQRTGVLRADILEVRTGSGRDYTVLLVASKRNWQGRTMLIGPRGHAVRCHVDSAIDYTFDFIRISVPRSCLGNPRYVRAGIGSISVDTPDRNHVVEYIDDAQVSGTVNDDLKLSKPLHRG